MSHTTIAVLSVIWWISIFVAFWAGQRRVVGLTRTVARWALAALKRGNSGPAITVLSTLSGLKNGQVKKADITDGGI